MQQNQIAKLDEVAKEAQNYIDKAEALSPNNAEIYILKKMNHGLKMMVNPMERWQTEGQAAQNALKTLLNSNEDTMVVILNMQNVPMIDMTGMVALKSIVDNFKSKNKKLIFSGLHTRIIKKLEKANFNLNEENLKSFSNIEDAINYTKLLVEK